MLSQLKSGAHSNISYNVNNNNTGNTGQSCYAQDSSFNNNFSNLFGNSNNGMANTAALVNLLGVVVQLLQQLQGQGQSQSNNQGNANNNPGNANAGNGNDGGSHAPKGEGNQNTNSGLGAHGGKGANGDSGVRGGHGNNGANGDSGVRGGHGNNGANGDSGVRGGHGNNGGYGANCGNPTAAGNGLTDFDKVFAREGFDTNNNGKADRDELIKAFQGQTGAAGAKGDTGATGAKGDTGATGAKGDKGDTGATGAKGDKGDTGATGAKGDKGDTGAAGAKGDKGDTGAAGPKGDTGAAGPKGDTGAAGPKGDTGAAGPKGDKGDTGATGAKGDKGDTGATGPKGDTGAAGPKGDTGAAGPKGDTGAAGPKGDTGAAGPKGDTGAAGPKGDTGAAGPKGDTGAAGPKGDTGATGPKGDTGATSGTGTKPVTLPGSKTTVADVDASYQALISGAWKQIYGINYTMADKGDYIHIAPEAAGQNTRHIDAGHVTSWNPQGKPVVISPIALDLNGDGKISTTGSSTAQNRTSNDVGKTVNFDIDGNGSQDNIEWMKGDGDGLLVDTSKIGANNAIDGNALFGDMGGQFANGYDKLAQHDANSDGKLSGNELKGFAVWVDNGDAKLQNGELRSLSDLGITEVSTKKQDVQNSQGETLMRSNAATTNGGSFMTEDVWFAKK